MRILYLDWPCFGQVDLEVIFTQRKYNVTKFFHEDFQKHKSESFLTEGERCFDSPDDYDLAFSYNYYPLMAELCHRHNLTYISFMYDNPQVLLYSETIKYETNRVFCFDSSTVEEFGLMGINHFFYMPLPVNGTIIDYLVTLPYDKVRYKSEISFVGSLYDEFFHLYDAFDGISDHTRGYIEGVMSAQSNLWGYSFMQNCLTKDIVGELQKAANMKLDGMETLEYLFAEYFLARKLTSLERRQMLERVSDRHQVKLWTFDENTIVGNCINCGKADYYDDMPYIFHDSKINLNITLRSIKNGIPLRCMDILGAGGFLLTNYQSDFFKHFIPDEDIVVYTDTEDMLRKIDYYLVHDEKRKAIAQSGHDKVVKYHNCELIWDKVVDKALSWG